MALYLSPNVVFPTSAKQRSGFVSSHAGIPKLTLSRSWLPTRRSSRLYKTSQRSSGEVVCTSPPYEDQTRRRQHKEYRRRDTSGHKLQYFATCTPGLEQVVAQELQSSQVQAMSVVVGHLGVHFKGSMQTGYRANLWLRSSTRVLLLLSEDELDPYRPGGDSVYDFVRNAAPWAQLIPVGGTFLVKSHVWNCSQISNSMLASTRTKDAICDALRQEHRQKPRKPSIPEEADVPLVLSLHRDRALLYRDMTGVSLHKRGYRDAMHKASLNEATAAGVLQLSGWREAVASSAPKSSPVTLLDPMCGSGTLLIEAALMAMQVAPGLYRSSWPFESWPDFDPQEFAECRREAQEAERELPMHVRIMGNDMHSGALDLASRDIRAAGLGDLIELRQGDVAALAPEE
ncbi:hypothetical protein CYMTET_29912, partial [Cymbomonas tetramitiformis]